MLRAPWGEPPGSERDDLEGAAEHAFIPGDDGEPLAVGRLHFNSVEEAQIRYMAVAPGARGRGLGRRIVKYLEAIAREHWAQSITLNARDEVMGFYQTLGYRVVGPGPTLFGAVKHVRMAKRLCED